MAEIDDILRKMVTDIGINILNDSRRFKAVFMDYSNGKYRGEMELVNKAIEIGAFNAITNAEDVSIVKQILIKKLHNEYFIEENMCIEIIETYTSVLRKDNVQKDSIENDFDIKNKASRASVQDNNSEIDFSDIEDELDDMNRDELKQYIIDNSLDIQIRKSMTDNDIRFSIRKEEYIAEQEEHERQIEEYAKIEKKKILKEFLSKNQWDEAKIFLSDEEELLENIKSEKKSLKIKSRVGIIFSIGLFIVFTSVFIGIIDTFNYLYEILAYLLIYIFVFCTITLPTIFFFRKLRKYEKINI
jgi:hypothetical protein